MTEEKKPFRRKIESTALMHKYMGEYFLELDRASKSGGRKIAWCTSVGPAELLHALGFLVYYPENHGAMLGSTRMATDLIPHANALGYSPEICSYLTSDIGSYLTGQTPFKKAFGMEGIPRPDVLVFNTNQCRDVKDWFSWYSREFKVPVLGVHTPRNPGELSPAIIKSVTQEIEDLVEPLSGISGKKFDIDELRHVVGLSRKCSDLWAEVLGTAAAVPTPLTFFDGTIHMGPAVVLRGTKTAIDYYTILLAELSERVKNGEAAIENEKFRIYWEGMPIWGRLRAHSELFAELKTSVLASTYCNSWIFSDLDSNDPFASMAKAYTELFIVRSDRVKEKYLKRMVETFKIDGILYHDAKSCPNNSNSRYGMPQRLERETGLPSLVINGDLNDLRFISDEQTRTNIEAFIEQIEEMK